MMGTVANARSSSASGGKNILLLLPAATCCYLLHRPCVCVHRWTSLCTGWPSGSDSVLHPITGCTGCTGCRMSETLPPDNEGDNGTLAVFDVHGRAFDCAPPLSSVHVSHTDSPHRGGPNHRLGWPCRRGRASVF